MCLYNFRSITIPPGLENQPSITYGEIGGEKVTGKKEKPARRRGW